MVKFNVPAQPKTNILNVDTFLGVDFTNYPTNIDENHSPNALNLVRDVPGKVRKMMGYHPPAEDSVYLAKYEGAINGVFFLYNNPVPLVHAGTKMYIGKEPVYDGANDARSKAWQFGAKMYLVDGKQMLVYDGATVVPVSQVAYTPTVTIAVSPTGGDGNHYEDFNLLSPRFTEQFIGSADTTVYQLSYSPLDSAEAEVSILNAAGEWVKQEATAYTVDAATGKVTFTTAPGVPPITSEDNVRITASRTVAGYMDRINKCDIGATFGVKGSADRLFLSGNPDYPNYDWYSGSSDPTYFPDLGYSLVGNANSRIMGYTVIDSYLAAHKDGHETERNVILRSGDLVDNKASFPTQRSITGTGATAKHSFAYLINEPLFLTELGVYAITPLDVTGEKYSQNRSFYVDGKLLKEQGLENAFAVVYQDYYMLAVNNKLYILDGLQPVSGDKRLPYSTRQYVCFYRENIPARYLWVVGSSLFFGTATGEIFEFFNDPEAPESYSDNGAAILARWETPQFSGKQFYKNKSFRYVAVRTRAAVATSVNIWGFARGLWEFLYDNSMSLRYFSFSNLIFSKITFACDSSAKLTASKIRLKRLDKAAFAFENDQLDEPFGLFDFALEYRESGNAKG